MYQKKWADSMVKHDGVFVVGDKLSLPNTIYFVLNKEATKYNGLEDNRRNTLPLYQEWYKAAVTKKLGTNYAAYPTTIDFIPK